MDYLPGFNAINDTHSPSVFLLITLKLLFNSASSTSPAFSASMPEEIKSPLSFIYLPIWLARSTITSASIFATAISKSPLWFWVIISPSSSIFALKTFILSSLILLILAFSMAAQTAAGSISRQNADFAPHKSALIARIPLPHPASRISVPGVI